MNKNFLVGITKPDSCVFAAFSIVLHQIVFFGGSHSKLARDGWINGPLLGRQIDRLLSLERRYWIMLPFLFLLWEGKAVVVFLLCLLHFFSRLASSYIRLSQTLLPGCFFLVMFMRSWISSIFSFVETFMSGKTNLSFTAAVAAFSPELIKGLIRFVEAGRRLTCWVEKRLTGWSAHQNPNVLSKSYFFF